MRTRDTFVTSCIQRLIIGLLACGSIAAIAAEEDDHRRDYDEALNIALQGESRIVEEMIKIRSNEIAHFDFLQFEHIQLIRHSRALAFPPADIATSTKTKIEIEANLLLNSAQGLELVIADYLRAIAQVKNATNNTADIITKMLETSSPEQSLPLRELKKTMTQMTTADHANHWPDIDSLFSKVLALNTITQLHSELALQHQQLAKYLPTLETLIQQARDSKVDVIAARLAELNHS